MCRSDHGGATAMCFTVIEHIKKKLHGSKVKEFTEIASKAQNILRFSEYHFDKIEKFCVFLTYNLVGVSCGVLIGTKRFR